MEENLNVDTVKREEVPQEKVYKMLPMRGKVIFPGQSVHFDIIRDRAGRAVTDALESEEKEIFLVTQKRAAMVNPAPQDIYRVGVLATIKQVQRMPGNNMRVLFAAKKRMVIDKYVSLRPCFEVVLKEFDYEPSEPAVYEALRRQLNEQFKEYRRIDTKMPGDVISTLTADEPERFISTLTSYLIHSENEQQEILQMPKLTDQYEALLVNITKEIEIRSIERRISTKVRESIDQNQREFYLHEQIRAIKTELGEDVDDVEEFRATVDKIKDKLPAEVLEKVKKEISRLEKMSPASPDANVSRSYIELMLDLPWSNSSEDNIDMTAARKILDEDHYGLDKVKDRIIEYLAVYKLTSNFKAPILCFVGPPGVGKTSIVRSIARATGRKFVQMSLGGVRDESEIRGHRRTYVAALPGRIIAGYKQAGVNNPVFLLDEIDKTGSDTRGDPSAALLEVLDPNQNNAFKDNYLELPFDLSKTMFVTTANTLETIPAPLLDRMEIIELAGYTQEEKLQIAKKYLKPKQIEANGLSNVRVDLPDQTINAIISNYTRESGVRNLEREIGTVMRKIAVEVASGSSREIFKINKKDLPNYLGTIKFRDNLPDTLDEVGSATGLAWTAVGGVTLNIEVALIPDGKGEIRLTGSIGDVMKESCMAALTLVRSRADELGIAHDMFTKYDIHIHFPDGATPKDGPSAGITIATALASAFSSRKVRSNVAMTGEVTLRGKVLAIGGLKEKSLAAYRAGISKILIPAENKKDLPDLPKEVTDKVEIVTVDTIDEVFKHALCK